MPTFVSFSIYIFKIFNFSKIGEVSILLIVESFRLVALHLNADNIRVIKSKFCVATQFIDVILKIDRHKTPGKFQ